MFPLRGKHFKFSIHLINPDEGHAAVRRLPGWTGSRTAEAVGLAAAQMPAEGRAGPRRAYNVNVSTSIAWFAGWPLRASAWTAGQAPAVSGRTYWTSNRPATFAPARTAPDWTFEATLAPSPDTVRGDFLSNGCYLVWGRASQEEEAHFFVDPSGRLLGVIPFSTPLCLCGRPIDVSAGGEHVVQTEAESVALLWKVTTDALWLSLAGAVTEAQALALAEEGLQQNAVELCQAERRKRTGLPLPGAEGSPSRILLRQAAEIAIGRVRSPVEPFPYRWYAGGDDATPHLSVNASLSIVAAWCGLDASVATEHLSSVLSCVGEDGSIPACLEPEPVNAPFYAPWPVLLQATRTLWERTKDREFLVQAIPVLHRHLDWLLTHYGQLSPQVYCWNAAEEALVPEAFDQGLATVDLSVLLLNEIEALRVLCAVSGMPAVNTSFIDQAYARLQGSLGSFFWDPQARSFKDRYMGGAHIARMTFSAVMPLLWPGLEAKYHSPTLQHLLNPAEFRDEVGAPLWLAWEEDLEPPPIRAIHQSLLLEGLARTSFSRFAGELAEEALEALAHAYQPARGLPEDLKRLLEDEGSAGVRPGPAEWDAGAALHALVLHGHATHEHVPPVAVSPVLSWLERHRWTLTLGGVAAMTLVIGAIAWAFVHKRTMSPVDFNAVVGLAQKQYDAGQYEEAIRTYEELKKSSAGAPAMDSIEFKIANIYLKQGQFAEAEVRYRQLLERGYESPNLRINLALAVYRQGRLTEAGRLYREIVDRADEADPELVQRAEKALALIETGGAKPFRAAETNGGGK